MIRSCIKCGQRLGAPRYNKATDHMEYHCSCGYIHEEMPLDAKYDQDSLRKRLGIERSPMPHHATETPEESNAN